MFCHENGDAYTSDQLNWRFSKMTRKAGIGRRHAMDGVFYEDEDDPDEANEEPKTELGS